MGQATGRYNTQHARILPNAYLGPYCRGLVEAQGPNCIVFIIFFIIEHCGPRAAQYSIGIIQWTVGGIYKRDFVFFFLRLFCHSKISQNGPSN